MKDIGTAFVSSLALVAIVGSILTEYVGLAKLTASTEKAVGIQTMPAPNPAFKEPVSAPAIPQEGGRSVASSLGRGSFLRLDMLLQASRTPASRRAVRVRHRHHRRQLRTPARPGGAVGHGAAELRPTAVAGTHGAPLSGELIHNGKRQMRALRFMGVFPDQLRRCHPVNKERHRAVGRHLSPA